MSNCIASELIKKGKTVLYQTAPVLLESVIDFKFGKSKNSKDDVLQSVLESDLLIIDDLGTESINSLKLSELFTIINTRILNLNNHITKTIISTNLNMNDIFSIYQDRIGSRIAGYYDIYYFFGEDLRLMVAGGAALDPEIEKGYTDLGFCVYQGYGLTETSPVIAAEDDKYRRLGSIGKAFPSVDVKIFEPNEDGIGELIAKAPSVMLGYYNNEEATKEAIDEQGWFHTGDLAKIDKDGYIFITGRKKYVIVLQNGKNIFPEELEALINKIEGVKESFVYGRPDGSGDYKICAKIVYDIENVEDIKETIWQEVKKMNKEMPAYKYVRDIIVTDKELIKTTTQKIKRHEEMKTVI